MSSPPADITIHEASKVERSRLRALVLDAVNADPANPFMASFRHEVEVGPDPAERFVEYVALVNEEIAARCQINFQPQPDDINAYGTVAADLYARHHVATLTSDLVLPAFRGLGLQAQMIRYRLDLLTTLGFTYGMCGILLGNDVSRDNYHRFGFTQLGEKNIDWGEHAVGSRIKPVALYGQQLGALA